MAKSLARQSTVQAKTLAFNLDNGAGTTIDEVVLVAPANTPVRLVRVYAIYNEATQTVAGGNFKVGTSVGGADLVAATAYENAKAIGVATTAVIVNDVVPAGAMVCVRHTGVAITQTGTANVVVEYTIDD